MHDGVAAAHGLRIRAINADLMAAPGKLLKGVERHARFNRHITAGGASLREAGRLQRLLQVHAEIHQVRYKLRVRKRLVRPAHYAEADVQIAALYERRNNGVKGTLAPGENIRALRVECKPVRAVLQFESHAIYHYA